VPDEEITVTQEGLARLRQELAELRNERLPQLRAELEQLRATEQHVEFDEASALEDLQDRLLGTETRIAELEDILERARVIDERAARQSDTIQLGSLVVVEEDGRQRTYELVGPVEADPDAGKLAIDSPVGSALLGKRVGDEATVETPAGRQRVRVKELK
jgi:transcription elongation factor GreA